MSGKTECDRKLFVDEHYSSGDGGSTKKCKYCEKSFKGKPPIQRLIIHLAQLGGCDVRPCLKVDPAVKCEAEQFCKALEASTPNQRKRKHTSISTNHVSGIIDPSSSRLQHVTESEGHERMTEHVQSELPRFETGGRENLLQEGKNRVALEQRGQSVCVRSNEMLAVDERMTGKSSPIVQNSLFQEYIDKIWFSLTQDNVQCVGVYGLGGVGKSTLVREIYNGILKNPSKFEHAYWINLLPDSNICELQDKIAQKLQINLPKGNGVFETREVLMGALMEKGRSVIVLDNMWKDFPAEDMEIPLDDKKYCKLIITSRSLDVCRRMGCRKEDIIKVEPLDMEVAQKLFEKTLSREIPFDLKAISKAIIKASYRLPSQISKLARNLRGEDDICEWRNELNKLKSLPNSDNEEIYDSLILSYNNLNNSALKECFLRCSLLFPAYVESEREYLINLLIVDGVIERMESRRGEFYKGHTMLNKLVNICLINGLKSGLGEICVDRLVRDMALKKLEKDSWVVIDTEEKMVNLQKKVNWEMEKLSLFKTTETLIECSPNCPNLRTLILHEYSTLSSIGESFFKQMHGLTFLDLENIRIIKLPDSISDLVNLVALMLNYCGCLEYVPSLAKLASLETLDLRDCRSLTKLPEGMENLFNLRCLNLTYLNLMKTLSKEEFPSEILPKLQVLQSLKVDGRFLKAKEVQSLKKLECLKCMFTEDEYIEIWTPILKEGKQILPWSDYDINVCGKLYKYDGYEGDADYQKVIRKELKFYECKSEDLQIPRDVKYLEIFRCYGLRSLHNIHPIEDATELSGLFIDSCRGLDSLFSLSAVSSNESTFSNKGTFSHLKKFDVIGCDGIRKLFPQRLLINLRELEVINVENCNLLEEVIEDGLRSLHNIHPIEDATELSCLGIYYCDRMKSLFPLSSVSSNEPTFSNKGAFSHLKEVYVDGCSSIRKLFPKRLLKNLQQLEVIVVSRCKRLEEVITMEDEGFTVSSDERSGGVPSMNINATLPNLNSLQLMWLPELKRICSGKLVCDALESLDVTKCPKLKWMPISFSGLDYGLYPSLRSVYIDNEAWENLEWEHPQVQDFLSARRMG